MTRSDFFLPLVSGQFLGADTHSLCRRSHLHLHFLLVLLVEDDADDSKVLGKQHRNAGYQRRFISLSGKQSTCSHSRYLSFYPIQLSPRRALGLSTGHEPALLLR